MKKLNIDEEYLKTVLADLLNIHSPSGYSDQIVHFVGGTLQQMGIDFNVTRRGAIRATLHGSQSTLDRALAVHLDTTGAMVTRLKKNGRLAIAPIGNWSSRFAEGSRTTIFGDKGPLRGTVLPLKASGHIYDNQIDIQPNDWDHVEIRVDQQCNSNGDLEQAGLNAGDFVAFDAMPEFSSTGFVNARHLDDKAGAAILLTVARSFVEDEIELPVDCHLIFTIFEEVGFGASAAVYGDVAEMVVIDHAPLGPHQNTIETGATIAMMDKAGPFDYHLSRKLCRLCETYDIEYARDVFRYYRSDSASAIEAGNDTRTALVGFGVDASHGYERTHLASLKTVADLIGVYMQSDPTFLRDQKDMASLKDFPHQPARDVIQIKT